MVGHRKRTLRDLSRDPPTKDDIEYMGSVEFRALSDRAAAIVAAGMVEFILEHVILRSLPNQAKKLHAEMLERGPLGNFSGKIQLAFALKLTSRMAFEDLNTIRRIRNAFAHSRTNITFKTEEIALEAQKLKTRMPHFGIAPKPPRELFDDACVMIWNALFFELTQIDIRRKNPSDPKLDRKYAFPPGDPNDPN
jgi:hypothetical protein